jgi:hypothetical protein
MSNLSIFYVAYNRDGQYTSKQRGNPSLISYIDITFCEVDMASSY